MPRPKRARRGRQPARADAEIATDAPPTTAAASATPVKQMSPAQPAQPDSSEKENRPAPDSFLSRLGSASGPQQKRALTSATRRRDSALRNLEAEDVTTSDSLLEAWALGEETTELRGRDRLRRNNASGLDVEEEMFTSMYSAVERPPSRGRSANTSTISAGQFMRRTRAPSVTSRDGGGHIRPSSRGVNTPSVSSTFNFGQFRRRAREPSILSASRRPRRETLSDDSDIELEDEFAPDAVSTPLERRQTRAAAPASSEAAVRTSGVRTRKRKSSEMEVETGSPAGNPSRAEQDSGEEENNQGVDDNEDDVANIYDASSLSSLASPRSPRSPRSPEADRGRPTTPVNLDEIMALPASSGSEAGEWPSIRKLAKRRRRMSPSTPLHARHADDSSDLSSPPSLTHSPNHSPVRAQTRKGAKARAHRAKRQASPSPQTAQLTSLLPARRNKHAREESDGPDSGDEVDVSGLGDDDDELAHMHTRSRRGASRSRPQGASARPGSRAGHPQSAAKNGRTPGSNRRVTRTYGGRGAEGDDSFGPRPDDSFTAAPAEIEDPKEELKNAVTKFKEVDRWELAFEEVTPRSSSPSDAR